MAVSLSKGGNVSLSKEAPGLKTVKVGLGWDTRVTDGSGFDLDASVFILNAGGTVRGDRARHRGLAAVVSGNGKQPVAIELVVQVLQVLECRTRGSDHVSPAVVPPALLQAEARAGAGNELPQA